MVMSRPEVLDLEDLEVSQFIRILESSWSWSTYNLENDNYI